MTTNTVSPHAVRIPDLPAERVTRYRLAFAAAIEARGWPLVPGMLP